MMGYQTKPETHVAAKQHRCSWCWQFINKGETYVRYRFFGDGVGTNKLHPECDEAAEDAALAECGWYEWTPGMERPAVKHKDCV